MFFGRKSEVLNSFLCNKKTDSKNIGLYESEVNKPDIFAEQLTNMKSFPATKD